jgi:hypothetical protein
MQRTLFGLERVYWLVSKEIAANSFLCVRIRGSLGEEQLRGAIDKLQRRHPLLRARLIRDQGEAVFTTEGAPRIPLQVTQDDGDGRSWLRASAVESLRLIDTEQGPLIRFVMVCHPLRETVDLITRTVTSLSFWLDVHGATPLPRGSTPDSPAPFRPP